MILLVDNGSSRPGAVRNLRTIAAAITRQIGIEVHPVPLQHAWKIPADEIDGRPAEVLEAFLARHAAAGGRTFLIVPLFFGPSRALTGFVPEVIARTASEHGPLDVEIADVLCPLPQGERELVRIMAEHIRTVIEREDVRPEHVIVVDHGSPQPAVTAVRRWLVDRLREQFGSQELILEAVMERRPGPEYDFAGRLLTDVLDDIAARTSDADVILAMQFISPGKHAGPGGDIADIAAGAMARHPGMRIHCSPLLSEHPDFSTLLARRILRVLDMRGPDPVGRTD